MGHSIFVINTGSTSTKIAVFEDEKKPVSSDITHPKDIPAGHGDMETAYAFREKLILDFLTEHGIDVSRFDCIVSRGCPLRPLEAGVYIINKKMRKEILSGVHGVHASNFGPLIAFDMGKRLGIPAYTADPVTVDELEEEARITGVKEIRRRTIFHALNQRAVGRKHAAVLGLPYEELTLIIAHLGGGVTVGLHKQGRVADVNNALDGEGPFSPERSGSLPARQVAELCFSGKYSPEDIGRILAGSGGFMSLLGTSNMLEVKGWIQSGNPQAELVCRAFLYRLVKEIGALAAATEGMVDGILLTGGIAHWKELVSDIRKKVSWIAPVSVYPGEFEMEALRDSALRVLGGEEIPKEY